ncbi:hypothetical protein [Brevibacillus sp. SYSU BS000544]|uniref:hypothetical protein n=1 Tax=Brevibacillus sp. SYSU BS000544 TaxID=3416443 RepID=UPI003CE55557
MFFEFQLSSQIFGRIVRNRIRAIQPCIDQEFDFEGAKFVIDHIDVPDVTTVQKQSNPTQIVWILFPRNYTFFTVPYLQVKQALTVRLVNNIDLVQNGPNPSQLQEFTVFPVFNVWVEVMSPRVGQGGPIQLQYKLDHIDYGTLSDLLPPAIKSQIEAVFASYRLAPTQIDLSPLSRILNRPVTAINAGITTNSGGDFVALRVEIRPDEDLRPEFFTQDPVNLLNGGSWAMLADARIFQEEATNKIRKGLANVAKFKLRRGPSVSWDPRGPALDISFGGELIDACPFFIDDIDMDVEAKIRAVLSVPMTNVLRTHYHIDAAASDIVEEVACAVTAALLWPGVGAILFDRDKIDLPKFLLGALIGPLIRLIAAIFTIETQGLEDDISRDLGSNCKKQNDENYECDDNINLTLSGLGGRLNLMTIRGVPQGPVLGGVVVNQRELPPGGIISVDVIPFEWTVEGRCRSGFSIVNKATILVAVQPPVALCSARIIDDPLDEFTLTIGNNEVTIRPKFKPEYVNNPYPCHVRLITTRGVRTITIPPPQAITGQEARELERERVVAIASCYRWERPITPRQEIEWLIDPPFRIRRFLQLWQVVVNNLRSIDQIRVIDREGRRILSALPSWSGVAHLALIREGESAPSELLLELEGVSDENQKPLELAVQQVLYVHRASVSAPRGLRNLSFEREGGRHLLVHTSPYEERRWDVSTPIAPVLMSVMANSGRVDSEMAVMHSGKQVTSSVTPRVSEMLKRVRPQLKEINTIGNPKVGGFKETLYLGSKQGGSLFDLSDPLKPREIQTFYSKPWFERTALSDRLLARYDPERGMIDIFEAIASRTI